MTDEQAQAQQQEDTGSAVSEPTANVAESEGVGAAPPAETPVTTEDVTPAGDAGTPSGEPAKTQGSPSEPAQGSES